MNYRAAGFTLGLHKRAATDSKKGLTSGELLGGLGGAGLMFGARPASAALAGSAVSAAKRIGNLPPQLEAAFRKSIGASNIPHYGLEKLPIWPQLSAMSREGIRHGAYAPAKGWLARKTMHPLMEALGPEKFKKYLAGGGATIAAGGRLSTPILAHELGHATGWQKLMPLQPLKFAGPLAGMAAGALGGYHYAKPDESVLRSAGRGALIGGGTSAAIASPVFAEEIRASVRGLRHLKRIGAKPSVLAAARRTLLKTFGTYGVGLAVPGIAIGIIAAMIGRWRKRAKGRKA